MELLVVIRVTNIFIETIENSGKYIKGLGLKKVKNTLKWQNLRNKTEYFNSLPKNVVKPICFLFSFNAKTTKQPELCINFEVCKN